MENLITEITKNNVPEHVGIIMDGNGRWAKLNKKNRLQGHQQGVKTVERIIEASSDIGVKHVTLYTFSTENWRRSKFEVQYLLKLAVSALKSYINQMIENDVRIRFIGSTANMKQSFQDKVNSLCDMTKDCKKINVYIAFNYGGRLEIIEAVQKAMKANHGLKPEDLNEELIQQNLYVPNIPDPDLILRTSGEQRISNFLLWQSAYSEFWFTKTLWPDFSTEEYYQAILDFQNRHRRFGAR